MPAAAVIPAPIAYIKVVAVKKLVVGFLVYSIDPLRKRCVPMFIIHLFGDHLLLFIEWVSGIQIVYFEKIRVFKAGFCREYISME